jgi:Ham1 family
MMVVVVVALQSADVEQSNSPTPLKTYTSLINFPYRSRSLLALSGFRLKRMAKPKLVFVTGNANKLREVREILGETVDLEAQSVDLPELQGTIEDISKDKCRRAAEIVRISESMD